MGKVAIVGLAVMGQNLALNFAGRGFAVSVHNRSFSKTADFLERCRREPETQGKDLVEGFSHLEQMVASLERPRRVILMVKAGAAVDDYLMRLLPMLEEGDILIDGGNSLDSDTARRVQLCETKGIHWVGAGISGGELGARSGPSVMLGGSDPAADEALALMSAVAARDFLGGKCCHWFGSGGAGHFVKTVHNGIEYGEMELLCEVYELLRSFMSAEELSATFKGWVTGRLGGYLTEITASILTRGEGDGLLVDKILDVAGQKGTGRWTCVAALEESVSMDIAFAAVTRRIISGERDLRLKLCSHRGKAPGESKHKAFDSGLFAEKVAHALWCARLVGYAQGMELLKSRLKHLGNFDPKEIVRTWSDGCILRSEILKELYAVYSQNSDGHLFEVPEIFAQVTDASQALKECIVFAMEREIATPALSAALHYFWSITSSHLPTNLLQAQRDYFGGHTYERVDAPRGEFFHTDWNETGGSCSASYNA